MRHYLRFLQRHTGGQSTVELALMLPFFILIVIGTIEFSYYIYSYSELENATRRASERAAKTPPLDPANPNNSSDQCLALIRADARSNIFLAGQLPDNNIKVSFFPGGAERMKGNQIEVTIDYQGNFLTPIGRRFFGNVFNFKFTSRRTIVDTSPPRGFDDQCRPNG